MKKILALMLVIVMTALALASCNPPEDPFTEDDWKAAFDFSNVVVDFSGTQTLGDKSEEYAYEMLFIQGTVFQGMERDGKVNWSVANDKQMIPFFDFSESFAKFTEAEGKYTAASVDITVDEETVTAKNIEITLKDGKLATVAFSYVMTYGSGDAAQNVDCVISATFKDYGKAEIPAEAVMQSWAYKSADIDDLVVVESYVQATQSWWDNKITVYLQDRDGAYFAYEMACTEEDAAKLVAGTKIRIIGTKAEWAGEVEIVDCTFTFIEGADTYVATAQDMTYMLDNENLIDFQNKLVSFSDMTVKAIEYKNGEPGDDIYVTLTKGEKDYSFCVERYLTDPESEVYTTVGELVAGDVVDVEGFLYWYNGMNPHITAVTKK